MCHIRMLVSMQGRLTLRAWLLAWILLVADDVWHVVTFRQVVMCNCNLTRSGDESIQKGVGYQLDPA
jgi:hypothetical protein